MLASWVLTPYPPAKSSQVPVLEEYHFSVAILMPFICEDFILCLVPKYNAFVFEQKKKLRMILILEVKSFFDYIDQYGYLLNECFTILL